MIKEADPLDGEAQPNRQRNIIIGVVVVVVILAIGLPLLLLQPNSAPSPLTLEEKIAGLESRLAEVELKAATNSETAADLRGDISDISYTDWTATFNEYAAEFDALQAEVGLLRDSWPPYALVTRVENEYVDVSLFGAGDYPVLVTLYGETIGAPEPRFPAEYTITESWSSNSTMTLAVEPVVEWELTDIIELKVSGVHYACAIVGEGAVVSTPGW